MVRKSILLITFAVTTIMVGIAFLFFLNSQTGSCWLVKSAISRFVKGAELKMVVCFRQACMKSACGV
jgi:hypothetical protein